MTGDPFIAPEGYLFVQEIERRTQGMALGEVRVGVNEEEGCTAACCGAGVQLLSPSLALLHQGNREVDFLFQSARQFNGTVRRTAIAHDQLKGCSLLFGKGTKQRRESFRFVQNRHDDREFTGCSFLHDLLARRFIFFPQQKCLQI